MPILGNSHDAVAVGTRLVDIPRIVSGISGDMQGKEPEHGHRLDVDAQKITDIAGVEGLGEIGKDHIAVVRRGRGGDAGAVAPQVFFALLGGAIGLLLVGAAFDAYTAIGVATGLTLFTEAIFDRLAEIVLTDPGILVLDIDGHDLSQPWDFLEASHARWHGRGLAGG